MDPILPKLGNVTIQRLAKPKDVKVGSQSGSGSLDQSAVEKKPPPIDNGNADLKRSFPDFGFLPPGVSLKKFKPDPIEKSQLPILNKSVTIIDKNQSIEKTLESLQRRSSDLNDTSYSDENEMTDYDSAEESDIESDTDLTDLGSLGLKPLPTSLIGETKSVNKQVENTEKLDELVNNGMASPSFLDKLVAEAEQAGSPSSSPPLDSPPPLESLDADLPPLEPKDEPQDDDYDIDIKEKLKEMGEITFGTVKKTDGKSKKEECDENEVSLTKKSGDKEEEVTLTTNKGSLRRNIREVMDETKLDEATLAAQREEAERLRRVQEQQRIIREYQRQAQQEKMQQRVLSLLQGTNFSKPGPSNQTRIGNTVLVKLPNGQTKPMTKLPKRPYDLMKVPRPDMGPFHPGMMGYRGPPFGHPRGFPAPPGRRPGMHLPPSMGPMSRRGQFQMPRHGSDSDSESEERRMGFSRSRKKHSQPIQPIDISSDDDCIVVSDSEADQQQEDEDQQDDPSNSGMHTNDEFNQPDEQGRVLVNVGHAEDEPDVFVAPQIAKIIKPHQIGGVRFMYDNVVESINRFESSAGFGCILAHSMGLGKTLQMVTFSDIFLRFTPAKTIICIMPINTLQNWLSEFNMWLPSEEKAAESPLNANGEVRPRNFNIHVLNDAHKTLVARSNVIRAWKSDGGVLLVGYEQFRLLSLKKQPKKRAPKGGAAAAQPENADETDSNKHMFDEVYEALVNPGPDLVICDEGHRIKNQNASTSAALKQVRTKRRIVLTGYPLQNNLLEYWCMVDFVRPNYLGSKTEFLNMFERPIMNGQCIDSTEADIKLMRYRAHVLHSLLVGFVQRRSHTVLRSALPQKEEYVLLMRLTPFQRKLYDSFMNDVVRNQASPNPLIAFAVCCKIWNHPDVLYNFLLKRSKGEAIDLDLEEVGNVTGETKAKKPSGRPRGRQTSPKGKNVKPAASVTPYTSNSDHLMQPPASTSVPVNPQANNSNGIATQTQNTTSNSSKTQQGPFLSNDVINQPRTSFEGIGQLFEQTSSSNTSQSQPISQPQPSNFNQSNQFDFLSPNSSFAQHLQNQASNSNSFSQNQNCLTPNSSANLETNSQESSSNQTFLNLDNQTTTTIKSSTSSVKLPAGISLTPTSKKNTQNIPNNPVPPPQSSSSHPALAGLPSGISLTPLSKNNVQNSQNPPPSTQQEIGFSHNNQMDQQQNPDQYIKQEHQSYNEPGQQENYNNQPNYWEQSPNGYNNPAQSNAYTSPQSPWIKKENPSPRSTPNPFVSPVKSETSNESKPKINIISDIKIPANKKISILGDFKPKKEELDDKNNVKQELEMISRDIRNDLKIEDSVSKPNESLFGKLAGLMPLKDTKEDTGIPYDWAIELLKDYVPGQIDNSAKFQVLFCIIKESLALGDRLLVFSQSLLTLDLIEQFLQASDIPGESHKWAKNQSYYRLDGSTGAQDREKMINEFNSNPKIHLFLVSTRAGSLGINLIGANRVVVLDASWNPCHDTQAVCRVYRYGQRKPCFVYRLVVDHCMEKKIYDRQVSKQGMSDRVVDECNPDAYLMQKDVSSLCFDEKEEEGEIKDWSSIKDNYIDVVLQKVLEKYGTSFYKEPFQHESLLVDRKEKQLSSQEKRLAKKGYEREKQAASRPSYLMGPGRGHRPVASVRPMQQGGERRPNRWIPAEHWQRQGMTAQEMTLPLDVVIPTNQPEKGNIVLKAGQKVLVLKSPKGVYMQLESGKIVAIKTAIKVKGKAEDNTDPLKLFSQHNQQSSLNQPLLPPQIKNNPSLTVNPQKRPSFLPNNPSLKVRSVKNVPNLPKPNIPRKGPQMARSGPYNVGGNSLSMEPTPGSSSEDEQHANFSLIPGLIPPERPSAANAQSPESADEIQKILMKKNISIQRVTNQQQPKQHKGMSEGPALARMTKISAGHPKSGVSNIDKLEQSANSILDGLPFQDTLESITANFKNPDGLDQSDSDENEHEAHEEDVLEEENEELGLEEQEPEEEALSDSELLDQSKTTEEDGDEVSYVSEDPADPNQQQYQPGGVGKEGSTEYPPGYNQNQGYYGYNVPPYQPPPHPQGYGYPPQQPATYDMGYQGHPPPYNYGYQGYPQPHYPPPSQPAGYDYSNPAAPANPPMPYPGYSPYPQQYPAPPQGMYPPPPTQGQTPAPPTSGYDYQQYPNQTPPNSGGYYPNT